jgi:hypothetical protein
MRLAWLWSPYLDTHLLQLWKAFLLEFLCILPAAEVGKVRQERHCDNSAVVGLEATDGDAGRQTVRVC